VLRLRDRAGIKNDVFCTCAIGYLPYVVASIIIDIFSVM